MEAVASRALLASLCLMEALSPVSSRGLGRLEQGSVSLLDDRVTMGPCL